MAAQYGVEKSDIFDPEAGNVAVRLTLGETHAINRTKKWLAKQGVSLDAMRGHYNKTIERSKTVILVKNIPFNSEESELSTMFSKFGSVNKVVLPPTKTIALVEFLEPSEARKAFKSLAYRLYQGAPLFLEWAPVGIMNGSGKQQISGEEADDEEEEEKVVEKVVEKKPVKAAKAAAKKGKLPRSNFINFIFSTRQRELTLKSIQTSLKKSPLKLPKNQTYKTTIWKRTRLLLHCTLRI